MSKNNNNNKKKHMYIHIKPYKTARIQCQQNMHLWHHERWSAETTMGLLDLKGYMKWNNLTTI